MYTVKFLGEGRKIEVCLLDILISSKYELSSSADKVMGCRKHGNMRNLGGNISFLKKQY